MDANAISASSVAPAQASSSGRTAALIDHAAKQYEAVFISQFLGQMFEGIPTDGPFGGGPGEQMFRSMMIDEYGKQMEKQGGIGLATALARELLKYQEKGH